MPNPIDFTTGDRGTLIRTFGLRCTVPTLVPPTSPDWHQFVVATDAPLTMRTQSATWLVPPGTGFWIPAGIGCSFQNRSEMSLNMLYLPANSDRAETVKWRTCGVLGVSPLLRELVRKVVLIGALVERNPCHVRLAGLIWDEVSDAPSIQSLLPHPTASVATAFLERLESCDFRADAIDDALRSVGCSRRTLERVFLRETHVSLGAWCRKRRAMLSIDRLLTGESVSNVAFDLGYNGPSAFITMFRHETGQSPTEYVNEHRSR